jgi:hypothetical protein
MKYAKFCVYMSLVVSSTAPAVAAAVDSKDCVEFAKVVGVNQNNETYKLTIGDTIYSNYCRDKQFTRNSNSGQKAEVLYEAFYGKWDASKGDAQTEMDKFCQTYDSASSTRMSSTAEQRQVSERAVAGFETCIKAASQGISIKPVVTPRNISIAFGSGSNALKLIGLAASKNLKCTGTDVRGPIPNVGTSMVVNLAAGETAKFDCERAPTANGAFYLPSDFSIAVGIGGTADIVPITLPGDRLVTPASANDLEAKIERLTTRTDKRGIVAAFVAKECPTPWKLYPEAMGRFIRGIDPNGVVDPDGVRQPGSVQVDGLADHVHTMGTNSTDTFQMAGGGANQRLSHWPPAGENAAQYGGGAAKSTNGAVGGIKETRPRNVALLFCVLN